MINIIPWSKNVADLVRGPWSHCDLLGNWAVRYLSRFACNWVQLIPCFNPCDHGISQLDEVFIDLAEFGFDLLGEFNVALLDSGALLREGNRLEEWDQFFLPVDSFVFLLQVHKWVTGFAVPDVRQPCLHSQSQVVTDNLYKKPN